MRYAIEHQWSSLSALWLMTSLSLFVLGLWLPNLTVHMLRPGYSPAQAYLRSYRLGLSCTLLLLLSACGTAPLPAPSCPPVPVDLLAPPQAPVLLQPASPLKTPSPTTSKTRPDAALTVRATSA